MIECDVMQDRMPAVARGTSDWSDAEAAHLATCAECTSEWRVIQIGASLRSRVAVDEDRAANTVLTRLRSEPAAVVSVRRIPWRGGAIGLLAAAASLLIVFGAPKLNGPGAGGASDTAFLAIAPDLTGLDDQQLETVLKSIEPGPTEVAATNDGMHLEDLTDAQLEKLLHSMGGE